MSRQGFEPQQFRRFSLSVRVSMGLVLAAIVPLAITILFSELQTRPALIMQANMAMQSDAKNRIELIDTYLRGHLINAQTLSQVTSVQQFTAAPPDPNSAIYQDLTLHANYALIAGMSLDKNYTSWALFNPQAKPLLFYPVPNPPAQLAPRGQYVVPPEDMQAVIAGKTFISEVYFSPVTQKAFVDVYSPILVPQVHTFLGFIRGTLNLDYIWNIVGGDLGNNGDGSYAFILDENGVRIADTNVTRRFKSVAQLQQDIQQRISKEERYGTSQSVTVLADSTFARTLHNVTALTTFEVQPAGLNEPYQAVQAPTTVVPWSYYVLSPINTVTAVANQQLLITAIIALTMSVLTAIIGLIAGRRITYPILASVEYLRNNSQSLTQLATSQQDAASEQMWVVDSSQVGLQSVQYYTDATRIAARKLRVIGTELAQNWNQINEQSARQAIEQITTAAQYIENATQYQTISNQKLSTALKVATQVTEQLVAGTTSATDAADQLQQVVTQLRSVVGK